MIELIREAAALFLAWSIGLTIVYGLTESKFPPLVGARIAFAASGPKLERGYWWGETLVYCPYCVGFWIQGLVGLSVELSFWAFVRGAALWITSLLLIRSAFDVNLVGSMHDDELDAIGQMRAIRKVMEKEIDDA